MTYEAMRQFADTWVLLAMAAIFIATIGFALRPSSKNNYDRLSRLPLDDDTGA